MKTAVTVADIDRLNPPKDAASLIRRAAEKGHALWGGWQANPGGSRFFGVRVEGPGWDVVALWSVPKEGSPYLGSLLYRQDAASEWTLLSGLNDAYARINAA